MLSFSDLEHLEHTLDEQLLSQRGERTFSSAIACIRSKLEEDGSDETFDGRSDGSSSNDSAVDMRMKDLPSSRLSHKLFSDRKYSVEPSLLNTSWDGRPNMKADGIGKCTESRMTQDWLLYPRRTLLERHIHPDDPVEFVPRSHSSSESFMSLDESSMLSPTSSMSSYSETDSELLHTKVQLEFYEARLRSRERFQELVRRWEAKQADQADQASATGESKEPVKTESIVEQCRHLHLHGIRERGEPGDPHLEKRFQELRKRWEIKETSPSEGSAAKSSGSSGGQNN